MSNKVLIISYFFSPSNFVGAERTVYWALNLKNYDIYPIVVTRCWNEGQKDIVGNVLNNQNSILKNKSYEIHYVKYKFQIRDLFLKVPVIRKFISFIYLLRGYLTPQFVHFNNIFEKADDILTQNQDITTVIISVRPFEALNFGYRLKKKHIHINWIADYRDQWTTFPYSNLTRLKKLLHKIERKKEKRWTSNAYSIISTTPEWTQKISNFTEKQGELIMNGFEGEIKKSVLSKNRKSIQIVYAGTLYPNQPIEQFVKVLSRINQKWNNFFELKFIGCEMIDGQKERLIKLKKEHIGKFEIIDRLSKVELEEIFKNTDLFYLTKFENVRSWLPVKMFDYAKNNKPLILYPSDNNVMSEFIKEVNAGFIFENELELENKMIELINLKKNSAPLFQGVNENKLIKYSREYQTKKLAEYFNDISSTTKRK